MKKKDFEEIYATAFSDPQQWRRWFMDTVVTDRRDDDIFLVSDTPGRSAATALLSPYEFLYADTSLPSGYISCVATRPDARAHGLASRAVEASLHVAFERGYAFAELIPATRALYGFYSRFGFADAFYADEERYTALHEFDPSGGEIIEPSYDVFHRLEEHAGCGVIHSEDDFRHIIRDLDFENGHSIVFARMADSYACLFASWDSRRADSTVTVRCLLADTDAVADTALHELRRQAGARPFTVWRPPLSGNKAYLRVRGMARIVHAATVLGALAQAHPSLRYTLLLHDTLIPANNGFYTIANGHCTHSDTCDKAPDLEVSVPVLSSILFSSEKIGNIFLLPTRRPFMALMLDQ